MGYIFIPKRRCVDCKKGLHREEKERCPECQSVMDVHGGEFSDIVKSSKQA